jgi:hypothetical protein
MVGLVMVGLVMVGLVMVGLVMGVSCARLWGVVFARVWLAFAVLVIGIA